MSLEHLIMPESKEVLKKMVGHITRTQDLINGIPTVQTWNNLSAKIIKDSNEL